jgi:hypothetical protein
LDDILIESGDFPHVGKKNQPAYLQYKKVGVRPFAKSSDERRIRGICPERPASIFTGRQGLLNRQLVIPINQWK